VTNLRHAVAHFNIEPVPKSSDVHSFRFTNDRKFDATITLVEMRDFVEKLADYLDKH
jgi:hypothetical protein